MRNVMNALTITSYQLSVVVTRPVKILMDSRQCLDVVKWNAKRLVKLTVLSPSVHQFHHLRPAKHLSQQRFDLELMAVKCKHKYLTQYLSVHGRLVGWLFNGTSTQKCSSLQCPCARAWRTSSLFRFMFGFAYNLPNTVGIRTLKGRLQSSTRSSTLRWSNVV